MTKTNTCQLNFHLTACEVHASAFGECILEFAGWTLNPILFHMPLKTFGLKSSIGYIKFLL